MRPKAVLLIGSPREAPSTSRSLGECMLDRFSAKGFETSTHSISAALREAPSFDMMMKDVLSSGTIILSYPLYIDSLPSDVTRWMEIVRDTSLFEPSGNSLISIGNCDSPDPGALDISVAIVKNFCDEVGLRFEGGLRMPMGPSIDGVPLEEAGRRARSAISAIERAVEALSKGGKVPEEAFVLMSRTPMSEMLYIMSVNKKWKAKAKKKGTRMDLFDKPCLK